MVSRLLISLWLIFFVSVKRCVQTISFPKGFTLVPLTLLLFIRFRYNETNGHKTKPLWRLLPLRMRRMDPWQSYPWHHVNVESDVLSQGQERKSVENAGQGPRNKEAICQRMYCAEGYTMYVSVCRANVCMCVNVLVCNYYVCMLYGQASDWLWGP